MAEPRDIISHRIFACDYFALKGADKDDTDKLLSELAEWVRGIENPYTDKNVERMWAYHRAKLDIAEEIIK